MVVELITRPRRIQRPLTVALVNNMPDGAFTDTEDQFHRLVFGAGPDVNLELYTITGTPRCENVAAIINDRYRGLGELWHRPPDALIVTGTEPKQAEMRHETYWPHLARLLEWAAEFVPDRPSLLSVVARQCAAVRWNRTTPPTDQMQWRLPRPDPRSG